LVYFIIDTVSALDLSAIERAILFHSPDVARGKAKDARGMKPFQPRMMVALLFLGYSKGLFSSRALHRATYEDVAMRVLCADEHPSHATIAGFRATFAAELAGIFVQILLIGQRAGMLGMTHWALDGTKIDANASKHKAMSYARMVQEEQRLKAEVAEIMARAEAADAQVSEEAGADDDASSGRGELKFRETRLARIRKAIAELEAEAAERNRRELAEAEEKARLKAEEPGASHSDKVQAERLAQRADGAAELAATKLEASGPVALPKEDVPPEHVLPEHEPVTTKDGAPAPKAQRNFTDSDSRIMKTNGGFEQGYNCQAVVDEKFHMIVGQGVSNLSPDSTYAIPMMARALDAVGAVPEAATMDAGYWSEANGSALEAMGVDAHIALGRQKHGERPEPEQEEPLPTEPQTARQRMAAKLATADGKAKYARRKATVEPVFGRVKEVLGFRRFSMRGIVRARAEWSFVCAVHNLLKIFTFGGSVRLAPLGVAA
jgi:transposase